MCKLGSRSHREVPVDFVDETPSLRSHRSTADDARLGASQSNFPDQVHAISPPKNAEISPEITETTSVTEGPPPAQPPEIPDGGLPRRNHSCSPFATREGAELMRYFIDHCSCFFDFSDIHRHFTYDVPLRARGNAMLANAMLALAARHRSRTRNCDPYIADRYYHDCLQSLIPRLGDSTAARDDELLAAIVILRLLEEMDVSIVGSDPQGHLFGTQAIITASRSQSPSPVTPLRKACYWAAFRQEIFMSLTIQRPFKLRLPEMAPSSQSGDDWSWTLRATYLCGKVQDFVFGDEVANVAEYHQLLDEVETWKSRRPAGFEPVYQQAGRKSESFPEIRLHMDCHVMGWQYIQMAHLLLIVHQPLPRVGPAHQQALKDMQQAAKEDVRKLCGVALSNVQTPPASFVACMAIALFGDRFESPAEQKLLRDLLIHTESRNGWPTSVARKQLEKCWDWLEDNHHHPK
ncbi:uncharacterized protein Z518_07106 [Rhinocladiella mackenziei CBS 650.93]|uniref:Uncharacterized protein n=1 Tax=Rhinocladiella mackenziei CBS 650.93 TaxID=1442369 RepID=A0A0D2GZG2_9EURO|nr:uncharacterized protein Z518_07106 [Rhinocladiella mackenziei CBS 650.93]KIX03553.1 hypothetical protein Z518_07106 [Rhinocladiella mackenziei CBS 650.93]